MNHKLLILGGLASLAAGCTSSQLKVEKPDRPNIIFIMTDDHSFQTLSAYDNRFIQTPGLDRIANEGVT
nr:sulfatase-like hydrolase/transferase [Sunxiuqinia sp.]